MRAFRLLILALPMMVWGCDGASPTGPDRVSGLRGQILDFRTRTPLAGAAIQFRSGGADPAAVSVTSDVSGAFEIPASLSGAFSVTVNGVNAGSTYVTGSTYVADLLVDTGTCVARYGAITDARTGRPVSGAVVSLLGVTAQTSARGWFVVDLGCPAESPIGFNTTSLYVTHPDYAEGLAGVGRGVARVLRVDVRLDPR